MRFLLILLTLALLPVMVGVHARQFARQQQPELEARALVILRAEGIHDAKAELRYLDLHVSGDGPDPQALERATAALAKLRPTRLMSNGLSILSALRAELQDGTLRLDGWLPDADSVHQISARLAALRPDLKIDATNVRISPRVRWPEEAKGPLADDARLLTGIIETLHVEPALKIAASEKGFLVSGALPTQELRDAIARILGQAPPERPVDTSSVVITHHIKPASFTEGGALEPFLRSYYGTPTPGDFSIDLKNGPRLQGAATPSLEKQWLGLLRQVSDGPKVELKLTRYPSIYHFPGYRSVTSLPAETLESLRRSLSDFYIVFDAGSAVMPPAAQARLAGLASTLLSAGPALRLVVGAHPDAGDDPEAQRRLALARAEQVRSSLIEQGTPATEIQALAFEPVPANTPGAPLQARSVEILIK